MNPTIAVSVQDKAQRQKAFDRDFPHLAKRQSETDRYQNNIELFAALDMQFRFQLLDSKDAAGNKEIFDYKTGALIEAPQPEDRGEAALRKWVLYRYAYNKALEHRSATAELEWNLRDEESEEQSREFKRLMAYAGYNYEDGILQPTEAKARELIQRNPSLAMDNIFGTGWKDK